MAVLAYCRRPRVLSQARSPTLRAEPRRAKCAAGANGALFGLRRRDDRARGGPTSAPVIGRAGVEASFQGRGDVASDTMAIFGMRMYIDGHRADVDQLAATTTLWDAG